MKGLSSGIIRILDKILSLGVKPGMSIAEESVVNKANFLFLIAVVLAVIIFEEGLRLHQYDALPSALAILAGALACFAVAARTGRPFPPGLLLLGGLSLVALVSISTGSPLGSGFLLVLVFPFLYFFTFSFRIAILMFFALMGGLALVLFVPGDPFLAVEYHMDVRQRIFFTYIFFGCTAILGEFMRWRAQKKIAQLVDKLAESARTDQLTGLYNRRAFLERFEYEAARSLREKHPLSLIMLDIDFFKNINDQHGHACGDAALQHLSILMRAAVRRQDTVARWGGEEFIILLPQTGRDGAATLAEKLRAAQEASICSHGPVEMRFTISLGVYQCDLETDIDANIAQVDARLYRAKRLGRNRVEE